MGRASGGTSELTLAVPEFVNNILAKLLGFGRQVASVLPEAELVEMYKVCRGSTVS